MHIEAHQSTSKLRYQDPKITVVSRSFTQRGHRCEVMTSSHREQLPALEGLRYPPGRPPEAPCTKSTEHHAFHEMTPDDQLSAAILGIFNFLESNFSFIFLNCFTFIFFPRDVFDCETEIRRQMSGAACLASAAHARHVVHGAWKQYIQSIALEDLPAAIVPV